MLDLLIKNATIIDGTGAERYRGDLGIKDGKITLRCDGTAKETIDAAGRILSPGFIDMHSHGDTAFCTDYGGLCWVCQGVTTQVTGNCGMSMFPVDPDRVADTRALLASNTGEFPEDFKNWATFERYCQYVDTNGLILNATCYVGHSVLRQSVMGSENRKPSPEEMELMKSRLREGMEHGALGMSSGLIYPPGCYADVEELIELAKVVAEYGGIYATHMRSESKYLVEAVQEAIRVGREAKCAVCISHIKVAGKINNEGKGEEVREIIRQAVEEGINITCDQYPYDAAMTRFSVCVPPKYFDKGLDGMLEYLKDPEMRKQIRAEIEDPYTPFENNYQSCNGWGGILIATLPKTPQYDGMFITEVAEKLNKDPFDTYFDLVLENEGVGRGIYFTMQEEDLAKFLAMPNTVVGSDGTCRGRYETTHPRSWGAFVHAICYYVKEKKLLSLEQMIRKMTSLTAERAHLPTKGRIAEGYDADLVLFDYDRLADRATYRTPTELADGVDYVIVNGVVVYHDKQLTGVRPGKLIRHKKSGV